MTVCRVPVAALSSCFGRPARQNSDRNGLSYEGATLNNPDQASAHTELDPVTT